MTGIRGSGMKEALAAYFGSKRGELRAVDGAGNRDKVRVQPPQLKTKATQTDVCLIAGTRPEIIKLAPVYHALKAGPLSVQFVFTGQHGPMAERALETFGIEPDVRFVATRKGVSLSKIQSTLADELDDILSRLTPSMTIVQGDTTTALMGALTSFNLRIAVGHVEAGLTTGDRNNPFPEETNRALIAKLASFHFAPTQKAKEHLLHGGADEIDVHLTGNTVVDAVNAVAQLGSILPPETVSLNHDHPWVLVTTHRREAWGAGLEAICEAVNQLAEEAPDTKIIWPVHSNPVVRDKVRAQMADHSSVTLLEPLDYPAFISLMAKCDLVLTDSGGVQEEAPSLGVPCLVMRERTERPEAVDEGMAKIVGHDAGVIVSEAKLLLADDALRTRMRGKSNPFGDGLAGPRIARLVETALGVYAQAAE